MAAKAGLPVQPFAQVAGVDRVGTVPNSVLDRIGDGSNSVHKRRVRHRAGRQGIRQWGRAAAPAGAGTWTTMSDASSV